MAELPRNAREVYTTGDPPEDGPRARKHRLTKEVKRMIESVALLDVHRVDDDELQILDEHPDESLRPKMEEAVRRCPKQALSIQED